MWKQAVQAAVQQHTKLEYNVAHSTTPIDSSNTLTLSEDVDMKRVEKKIKESCTIYSFVYNRPIRTIDDGVQSVPVTRRRYSSSYSQTYTRCSNTALRCHSAVNVCRTKSPK